MLAFSAKLDTLLHPATHSAQKFRAVFICNHDSECGEPLVNLIKDTLKFISAQKLEADPYGLLIMVPRHGVFIASQSIERAMYYLNKFEENARTLILEKIVTLIDLHPFHSQTQGLTEPSNRKSDIS